MGESERESLKAEVKMPLVYKSEEDLEVDWYIHRGHKLLNKMKCQSFAQR